SSTPPAEAPIAMTYWGSDVNIVFFKKSEPENQETYPEGEELAVNSNVLNILLLCRLYFFLSILDIIVRIRFGIIFCSM
ncbi:hypothetical protein ACFS7Z_27155, partial [Pontibacter toksunensis]